MVITVKDALNSDAQLATTSTAAGHIPHHNLNSEFLLRVSRGDASWARLVSIRGRNGSVSGSLSPGGAVPGGEPLTPSGEVNFPSSAQPLAILSSSASDANPSGIGARTVLVEGLSSAYAEISETVALNGTTAVVTANSYLRVNRLTIATLGSNGANVGVISVKDQISPFTSYRAITVSQNYDFHGTYTIPAGWTGFLLDLSVSTRNLSIVYSIQERTFALGGWIEKAGWNLAPNLTMYRTYSSYVHKFIEKSDVRLFADRYAGSTDYVSGSAVILLVQNTQAL